MSDIVLVGMMALGFAWPFMAACVRGSKRHPENADAPIFQWFYGGILAMGAGITPVVSDLLLHKDKRIAEDGWTFGVLVVSVTLGSALGELVRRDVERWRKRRVQPPA